MKTTIEIPEPLYKKIKIRAIKENTTLKELFLRSLAREIASPSDQPAVPYFAKRQFLRGYAAEAGAFRPKPGTRDITDLISEERDAR